MFQTILGNEETKSYLRKAVQEERLPQALLFFGIEGIGKSLFVKELASYLLDASYETLEKGNHPDFCWMQPEGKSALFSIDQVREMSDKVYKAPFLSDKKVFILENIERMQPAAFNALLKTLEEPSPDSYILATTTHPQKILPTILSRFAKIAMHPLREEEVASLLVNRGLDKNFAKLAGGSMKKAMALLQQTPVQELVFSLLREKRGFHERALFLEKLEEGVSKEDPIQKWRDVESIFSLTLLWVRDQHLRKMGEKKRLLFPEESEVNFPLPSLEEMEKREEMAKDALELNLPLSAIFAHLYSS